MGAWGKLILSATTYQGGPLPKWPLSMAGLGELELEELAYPLYSEEFEEEGKLPSDIPSAIGLGQSSFTRSFWLWPACAPGHQTYKELRC